MSITPNEILNKEFDTKFRGYDAEQVNDFLDIVRVALENQIAEKDSLKKELDNKKEKLDYFSQLQDSLNSSIMVAQDAAERLKQNARKEAELILFEAEREADRLVNEASEQSRKIYTETEELRQTSKTYRQRLKQIVEAHLSMVNDEEVVDLFDGGPETEAIDFPRAAPSTNESDREPLNEFTDEQQGISSSFEETENGEFEENQSMPLSRQELEMAANKVDQETLAPADDFEIDKEDNVPMESVLGQTIRIDLPK